MDLLEVAAALAKLTAIELLTLKFEAKGVAFHDFYVPNGSKETWSPGS